MQTRIVQAGEGGVTLPAFVSASDDELVRRAERCLVSAEDYRRKASHHARQIRDTTKREALLRRIGG